MVESGDWITPRFNYHVRFEKPILFYWMIAATYAVTGVSEAAARFWAAMSGVGLVLVAAAIARRWVNEDTVLPAGAITATGFATAAMARQSLPDLPLAFFITVSVWCAFEALARDDVPPGPLTRRWWLVASACSAALAVLTKGPIGLALPVLIVAPVIAFEIFRGPVGPRRLPVTLLDLGIAAVVFLAVAVPWYAAVTWVHGQGYLYRFFVGENLDRFATARYNDPRPIWFYLPIIIGGLLPWSPVGMLWMRRSTAGVALRARSGELLRLGSWALAPLIVFSISVGKQPRYILPCLVPLAVILGMSIASRVRCALNGRRDILLNVSGAAAAIVIGVAGILLYRVAPIVAAVNGRDTRVWAALVIAAAVAALVVSAIGAVRAMPMTIACAASLTLVALHGSLMAGGQPDAGVGVAEVISRHASPDQQVCACGAFLRNLPFYVRRQVIQAGTQEEVNAALGSATPVIAAIDGEKLEQAETALNRQFERLAEASYLNTALLRIDDFITPDPERVVQRVVVIRTR